MARAWKGAVKDLGIEFEAPFAFKDRLGRKHVCSSVIPNFGSKPRVLVISGKQDPNPDDTLDAASSVDKYRLSAMSSTMQLMIADSSFMPCEIGDGMARSASVQSGIWIRKNAMPASRVKLANIEITQSIRRFVAQGRPASRAFSTKDKNGPQKHKAKQKLKRTSDLLSLYTSKHSLAYVA